MSKDFPATERFSNFVELLRWRGINRPDRLALTFLRDGETEEERLTYAQLDERARTVAATLQAMRAGGSRALLLYPAGLDFIVALLGCFYAKVVAVPAYPPHFNRPMPRLQAISADAGATLVLTNASIREAAGKRLNHAPDLKALTWLATDEDYDPARAAEWRMPSLEGTTLGFLQYTSGSTSQPKGVMVSHANLLANERMIATAFEHTEQTTIASWLPLYHDMGLIGNVLQSLYAGGHAVLMSPTNFLQKPLRWLEAVSRYRAHTSGAPNFAYELCVQRVTPEQKAQLDLSSWSLAFNGAEPVREATLTEFARAFAPCGFRREAFYPCYGLAEAIVFVSGGRRTDPPVVERFDRLALEGHRVRQSADGQEARALVGCGRTWLAQKIAVVNPETLEPSGAEEVGEILVAGPHVASGYWNRPEETAQTFQAYLHGTGEGPYLRTGDLGFMRDGELFITGRLKDLIIVRGRNHYPQDIELTVERSHEALGAGACAAFSVGVEDEERLVVVAEVKRHFAEASVAEVLAAIRQSVAEQHELEVYAISLLRTHSIPKTTSGKIQRRAGRAAFIEGTLDTVGSWKQSPRAGAAVRPAADATAGFEAGGAQSPSAAAIQSWLISRLAARTGLAPREVDMRKPFTSFGLDSASAVAITAELGAWLGRDFAPTLLYEQTTIAALARHLAPAGHAPEAKTLREKTASDAEPVAIVGIGCRFPGADGAAEFWRLLCDGVDAVTEVPTERWDARAFYSSETGAPGKMNTLWGGFLNQVDRFDAQFFGISPREAVQMDPQHRLLLEVAWEALEDGGHVPQRLAGTRTGVFVGMSSSEYAALQLSSSKVLDPYATTGGAPSIASNRLSYFFDFRGPSMTVDTACSSSLVAVHLACRSIRSGESEMALAGGVNLVLSPAITVGFSQGGATSPGGRCKPFAAAADGIVRSEGVGLVVLKPLSRAEADGDRVYAVIRGSAVTQDGRSNGITAPSLSAQEDALREAYRVAGVSASEVQYVETHGTGTLLGDPIEAGALGRVLAEGRPAGRACRIGSVKSNIGHTEAAAGIASLIKVALAIKRRTLPPSLHFDEPNPHIAFEELRLKVQQSLEAWPADGAPALAGVSAFGFGGTNAHVVLEEAPAPPGTGEAPTEPEALAAATRAFVLPLSAHNPEALQARAVNFRDWLASDTTPLEDVCYTAGVRRNHHDQRLAVVARTRQEVIAHLDSFAGGESRAALMTGRVAPGAARRLVFVFSGYGGQFAGMGRELLRTEPVFRQSIAACEELLRPYGLGWSLSEELPADAPVSRLDGRNLEVTQISLFALQVGLAALWRAWGVEPDAVVGHSLGEVAAAHVAGALSLADAVRVIFHRSRLMQQTLDECRTEGGMASLSLPVEEVGKLLKGYEDRISIAVHNAPGTVVVAGEAASLRELVESLAAREVPAQMLAAPGAGHSPQAEGLKKDLTRALGGLAPGSTKVAIFSTVTGQVEDGRTFDAHYWGRNVRQTVLFSEAVGKLAEAGYDTFLEIGPQPTLLPAVVQNFSRLELEATVLPSLRRKKEERGVMLRALATLYTQGHAIDWAALDGTRRRCVPLPSYPWQRERFWIEGGRPQSSWAKSFSVADAGGFRHPLLGRHLRSAAHEGVHLWELDLDADLLPRLRGGDASARPYLPFTAYTEMALAAAGHLFGLGAHVIEDMDFHEALALHGNGTARTIQLVVSTERSGAASFKFFSLNPGATTGQTAWTLNAQGRILPASSGIAQD